MKCDTADSSAAPPTVTIGLVTLNEENVIGPCIDAILEDIRSMDAEIIVVAGGKDRTVEIVRSRLSGVARAKVLLDMDPRGKPAALNRMVSEASGKLLVLSDGDVRIRPGSIPLLITPFSDPDVGCCTGRVVGAQGRYNAIQKVSDHNTHLMHLSREIEFRETGSVRLASGYILAVRRALMPRLPEDTNSDDGYISAHVRSTGRRIAYVPDAVAEVRFPTTVQDFVRQKSRTRFGHVQVARQFHAEAARSATGELIAYLKLRSGTSSEYGLGISVLSFIMTGLSWVVALSKRFIPGLAERRIWVPIGSTKG